MWGVNPGLNQGFGVRRCGPWMKSTGLLGPEVEFSSLSLLEDPILHFAKVLNYGLLLKLIVSRGLNNFNAAMDKNRTMHFN
jgi:hypothetical protein